MRARCSKKNSAHTSPITLTAPGGKLVVDFETRQNGTFHGIFLTGPVELVFETEKEVDVAPLKAIA